MTDRFDELARAWGEDGCTLWRRESCDRFPNGCPECPAQFADGVAALLRRVDTEAEERGRREEGQPLQSTDVTCRWTEDDSGVWESACGAIFGSFSFEFPANGPTANGFNYCPYCGAVLEEAKRVGDTDTQRIRAAMEVLKDG